MLPPVLEIYVVWHPKDVEGASIADEMLEHFHGTSFSGLIGGAVELYVRSEPWADDGPRPIDLDGHASAAPAFAAIVPLIGKHLALACENIDSSWDRYTQSLSGLPLQYPGRVGLFPYALDFAALDGTRVGRAFSAPQRIAANPPRPGDSWRASRCRDLAQGIAQFLTPAAPRITAFLSHTKKASQGLEEDSAALIKCAREIIAETRLREFFDASDLQPGRDWDKELRDKAATSALLAIRSELYPTREWCQREMLAAKEAGMPIVIVDAIGRPEERGSFLMDHVPRVPARMAATHTWNRQDIYSALNLLVDECLKRALWRHQQNLSLARSDIAWWAPHAPEPVTLLNWLLTNSDKAAAAGDTLRVLHPDPPLGPDERAVLERMLSLRTPTQRLDIMTPRLLAARGG